MPGSDRWLRGLGSSCMPAYVYVCWCACVYQMPNAAWVKLCQILMGFQMVSLMMMMMMITLIVLVYSWPNARGDASVGVKVKIVCEFRVQFFIIIRNYTKPLGTFEFRYKCT